MKPINQRRRRLDLYTEHGWLFPIVYTVRATIQVIEALTAAGAIIKKVNKSGSQVYRVTLGKTMPAGIIACMSISPPWRVDTCLRMEDQPKYPVEFAAHWEQVAWTPCPVCGAPVVPGYRVCSQPPHHHSRAD